MRRKPEVRDRNCCDGGCVDGGSCPLFAPGVIEGPFRQGPRRRRPPEWLAVLAYPLGVAVALVAWLLGSRP